MHKLASKLNNDGFSLLEVLVAFSIAAVTLGVLFQIYAKGTRAAILGEEYAQAIVIAESRLAKLSVTRNIGAVETAGSENDRYEWEVSIEDYMDEAAPEFSSAISLKKVGITVTWYSAGRSRSVSLQTLKPVPAT